MIYLGILALLGICGAILDTVRRIRALDRAIREIEAETPAPWQELIRKDEKQ